MTNRRINSERSARFSAFAAALMLTVNAACTVVKGEETKDAAQDERLTSAELQRHFSDRQSLLLNAGLLRTDPPSRGEDFDAADLAANFEQIALRREFELDDGEFVRATEPNVILRWRRPVRIAVVFGESLKDHEREAEYSNIAGFAERLRRITGHDIAMSEDRPNLHVFVIDSDEAADIQNRWPDSAGKLPRSFAEDISSSPPQTYCAAYATNRFLEQEYFLSQAVVLIKAENPRLIRLSCIHEELAQALGLFNDSLDARPSIFNDDEEFALLTHHDELLLRILYDPRIKPGMDAAEAMPIVREIALELRPDA